MIRRLVALLGLALATVASPASATMPDLSGTWSGTTSCPVGRTEYNIEIQGATGRVSHSHMPPYDIRLSSFQGHEGVWIRLTPSGSGGQDRLLGLVVAGGRALRIDAFAACSGFTLVRISKPGDTSPGAAPSKAGPPNSDAIIQAYVNELVAMGGAKLATNRVLAHPRFMGVELTIASVRDVRCRPAGVAAYDCAFTRKITAFAGKVRGPFSGPQSNPMKSPIEAINDLPQTADRLRLENRAGTWRSSTLRERFVSGMPLSAAITTVAAP